MRVVLFILLFTLPYTAHADRLTFYYAPSTSVDGDVQEDDLFDGDDFTFLSVGPGTARALRWTHEGEADFYLDYASIEAEDDDGRISRRRYQALSAGLGVTERIPYSDNIGLYGSMSFGAGISRFNFNDIKHRAHADMAAEGGLVLFQRFTLGLGLRYQIVGYPGETMADALFVNLNGGLAF